MIEVLMPKEMAVIEIAWEFYELILRDVVERIDFLIRIVVGMFQLVGRGDSGA